jgi:hypothetical protein
MSSWNKQAFPKLGLTVVYEFTEYAARKHSNRKILFPQKKSEAIIGKTGNESTNKGRG